jgi:putative endonuclease
MDDNKISSSDPLNESASRTSRRSASLSRRTATGRAGELAAVNHLLSAGYLIVEKNWRCSSGEIDIIAEDNGTLVFVEVRARTNPTRYGSAIEAITPRKCRQVRELAVTYLKQRKGPSQPIRFDVIAVTFLREDVVAELKHLQAAF